MLSAPMVRTARTKVLTRNMHHRLGALHPQVKMLALRIVVLCRSIYTTGMIPRPLLSVVPRFPTWNVVSTL